ncbi:MAG: hypothetical protein R3Y47_12205 [Lachnospiraceae bacterium]
MKKLISFILVIIIACCFGITAFAITDSNVDSGGGEMGDATSTNAWIPGRDGVRVTIVRANDNQIMTTPIDFSDEANTDITINFGNVSKLSYLSGTGLSAKNGEYVSVKPASIMPTIITSTGTSNIDVIRAYFCREGTIQDISNITGFNYDLLISGEYKILLEPIAYFKYESVMYAMTATEAALFNQETSNKLRSKMVSLTHQNLPLSMFLETSDLGLPTWGGTTGAAQTDQDIISYLGMGIISFSDVVSPSPSTSDVTYRCDTDVITSVTLYTSSEKSPDNPAYATFSINGRTYAHSNIYIPEDGSQLAWVKWHTPSEPGTISITITSNCTISTSTIVAEIVSLDENEPPDPQANDRNDSYATPSVPSTGNVTSLTWGEWDAWWYEYWIDNGHWDTDTWTDSEGNTHTDREWVSNWEDEGWYVYEWISHYASLSVSMNITPDEKSPTATSTQMKSGYGFNMAVTSNVTSSAPTSHYTGMQNVVAYFPEFQYQTYWRLLDRLNSGYSISHAFKINQYSTYGQRVHFTPVWYPNGTYTAYATCIDAWTPAGMMSINLTDYLYISGSLFDDWHIAPTS